MSAELIFEPAVGIPLCWFTVAVPRGGALDPPGLEGFTRHTAELARRGAGGMDRAHFDDAVDRLGASLDVEVDRDWLALSGTCLERNLDRAVALAAAVLADPMMSAREHEVLQRETLAEIDEVRDDDGTLVERYFQMQCAPGHVYGRTLIGTADSLARLDREAAARHHRALWTADGMVIGVAGPITPARAREVAGALEAAVAGRTPIAPPAPSVPEPPPGRRLFLIDKPQRTQCQLWIGHLAPAYGTADFLALMPVETAFGGMFSSRLMQEIRVKRGWSYGAGCRIYRSRAPHWFRISLAPTREVAADALSLTLELFEQLASGGITDAEHEFAVRHLTGGMLFSQATPRQRMRQAVRHRMLGLDASYPRQVGAALERLPAADARAAATRWLRPRDLCITLIATADDLAPELAQRGFAPAVIPYDSY
ncbi:MAG TPA: pitrilysin family protein [Kofleriaceae bacterium]|nr:pitrilysin family protein [Kofleriaceae bacterium]